MPIVTLCKSCNAVYRAVLDRCKFCGSQRVTVKTISDDMIIRKRGRDVLVNFIKDRLKC